ncbi:hypothetical protein FHN55_20690 [Streptomyces sp. NP160]|uniref:hypothetical protein n=1 Tax=Streptomyces sp. NP160 TaxID=2586637 RepID=UPI00111ADB0E|nr:hypothetical protein [Streptomyces sp. NP160]TNM59453.1 hypothetical protein FHN55_20690 [Streptomyces sp. NP160]
MARPTSQPAAAHQHQARSAASTSGEVFHVLYPRGFRSGGPEALHQLVHTLRGLGADASLVPEPGTEDVPRHPAYGHYDAPEAARVADVPGSVVIAPEKALRQLARYRHAQTYCWWLSIDMATPWREHRRRHDLWSPDGRLVEPSLRWRAKAAARHAALHLRGDYRQLATVRHLAQSEYARAYLYARADVLATVVGDWTPLDGLDDTDPPGGRSTVTYNPAKAREAVEALRLRVPEVEFVALEGMTREQLVAELRRSLVYLDLGYHPGKDRMPREAALCGAVTVVARRGSGAFHADVPLPWEHKVSPEGDFVGNAARVLRRVLAAPAEARAMQDPYRAVIRDEERRFTREVREALVEHRLDAL